MQLAGVQAAAGKVEAELQRGHRGRGVPGLKRPRSGGARVVLVKNNKGLKEIGAVRPRAGLAVHAFCVAGLGWSGWDPRKAPYHPSWKRSEHLPSHR